MKRRIKAAFLALFISSISLFISPAGAQAADSKIILLDAPHTNLLGASLNTELSTSLLPTGRLGQLVFTPVSKPRTWLIDAALVEEVGALAAKDPSAQNWLAQLKLESVDDVVVAVPYGHPELSLTRRLAPSELAYYYDASRTKLQVALGREVLVKSGTRWTTTGTKVVADAIRSYTTNRRAIALLSTVVPPKQLDDLRSKLAFLLSSGSTTERQLYFAQNADLAVAAANHKLRIVPGKYRLTSEHEKVPITLVNDFGEPVRVTLQLTPLNSRIKASGPETLSLAANSKTQLAVPFTVVAPGATAVLAEFRNSAGKSLGDSVILTLNLSVISPAVAWFTTGAAILLFLAATTQSVRRVRRSRK
jgi:hypothetical protein